MQDEKSLLWREVFFITIALINMFLFFQLLHIQGFTMPQQRLPFLTIFMLDFLFMLVYCFKEMEEIAVLNKAVEKIFNFHYFNKKCF